MNIYIKWLGLFFWLPTIILMIVLGLKTIKKYFQVYLVTTIGCFLLGFLWDFYAINLGIWYYPQEGVSGISLLTLPVEELIFLATVPSFIISAYLLVDKIIKR